MDDFFFHYPDHTNPGDDEVSLRTITVALAVIGGGLFLVSLLGLTLHTNPSEDAKTVYGVVGMLGLAMGVCACCTAALDE